MSVFFIGHGIYKAIHRYCPLLHERALDHRRELQANIQSYLWEFDLGSEIASSTTRDATITFPGVGEYTGTMIVNEGLFCADTADISVNIFPSINSDFEFDYDTCFGNPESLLIDLLREVEN